jgi:hypothetical protein
MLCYAARFHKKFKKKIQKKNSKFFFKNNFKNKFQNKKKSNFLKKNCDFFCYLSSAANLGYACKNLGGLGPLVWAISELFGRPSPSPRTSLKSESENFGL